ncbi:hypothetical protein D8S78_24010, partial [Natrialba swarupiae]|nr:hypothetical protein [Natrialba swarupiae]
GPDVLQHRRLVSSRPDADSNFGFGILFLRRCWMLLTSIVTFRILYKENYVDQKCGDSVETEV